MFQFDIEKSSLPYAKSTVHEKKKMDYASRYRNEAVLNAKALVMRETLCAFLSSLCHSRLTSEESEGADRDRHFDVSILFYDAMAPLQMHINERKYGSKICAMLFKMYNILYYVILFSVSKISFFPEKCVYGSVGSENPALPVEISEAQEF